MEKIDFVPTTQEETSDTGKDETMANAGGSTTFQDLANQVEFAGGTSSEADEASEDWFRFAPEEAERMTADYSQESEAGSSQGHGQEAVDVTETEEEGDGGGEKPNGGFIDINRFATSRGEDIEDEKKKTTEREKTHAEKRLESVQQKLAEIEAQIAEVNEDNARLEEKISECETALDNNAETHSQLTEKVDQLRDRVNKTKRSILSGFADGLKIVKNLALGKHREVRDIINGITNNVNENEQAMKSKAQAEQQLRVNEAEKKTLSNERADAIDIQNSNNKKLANLKKWRADLQKQESLLQDKVAEDNSKRAWEDAREAIKAEMGTDDMKAFRKKLIQKREELEESYLADMDELDGIRKPSRIQRMMRTEQELREEAERADRIEARLTAEHDREVAEIEEKLAKVEEYFPTWGERVAKSRENPSTKRGLATIKRKVLLRMYNVAA